MPDLLNLHAHNRHSLDIEPVLRTAFEFLRRHGRYTPSTLHELLRIADNPTGSIPDMDWMRVVVAERPYEYDSETETKKGGIGAVGVVLPDRRLLLAVHRSARRQGIGRNLLADMAGLATRTWVNRENTAAQQFLLASGWHPTNVNEAGAVCYSTYDHHEDMVQEPDEDLSQPSLRAYRPDFISPEVSEDARDTRF